MSDDQIARVGSKIKLLRAQLRDATIELHALRQQAPVDESRLTTDLPMSMDEYCRYGRQLIMPDIGIQGQLRLRSQSVLIVGGGGLGCPAAAYLAGAGVGSIGIMDGDIVETSNLHRQILHSSRSVGLFKSQSIANYIHSLNPHVKTTPYTHHLTATNALTLVAQYDLVLDCTDMPASRYLVSDACVLAGKPLVSGSALRTDGQLMLLNNPPALPGHAFGGPCYRCIWPMPPPAETVMSCGEAGILGPVVGTIGTLMALEAIKVLTKDAAPSETVRPQVEPGDSEKPMTGPPANLLVFSAFSAQPFRSVRLKGRRADCKVCSARATIERGTLESGSLDYELFCGRRLQVDVLGPGERIVPTELANRLLGERPVILDVREKADWQVFNLPGSINIPWSDLSGLDERALAESHANIKQLGDSNEPIVTMCRLGNDSQLAVKLLQRLGLDRGGQRSITHVEGGWARWRRDVPGNWPDY